MNLVHIHIIYNFYRKPTTNRSSSYRLGFARPSTQARSVEKSRVFRTSTDGRGRM